jgi:hypothetical protein
MKSRIRVRRWKLVCSLQLKSPLCESKCDSSLIFYHESNFGCSKGQTLWIDCRWPDQSLKTQSKRCVKLVDYNNFRVGKSVQIIIFTLFTDLMDVWASEKVRRVSKARIVESGVSDQGCLTHESEDAAGDWDSIVTNFRSWIHKNVTYLKTCLAWST